MREFYSINRFKVQLFAGMKKFSDSSLTRIGERIRVLREALGYSNASQFAAFVGWSSQQLSNYENGQKRPEVNMAILLCSRTGATLDYIYRGEFAGLPMQLAVKIQDFQAQDAARQA